MDSLLIRPRTPAELTILSPIPRYLPSKLHEYFISMYQDVFSEQMNSRDYDAAVDALPAARLSRIQSDFPPILHALGIRCTIETFPNTTRTYLLIHFSETVKLVVCYVSEKGETVRWSKAREDLAREYNGHYSTHNYRLLLSQDSGFGILRHYPYPGDIARFGGADIIIPSPDSSIGLGYLDIADEMDRVQREDLERAKQPARKVTIKIKEA